MEYFATTLNYIKLTPGDFPDPGNRKKRVLEVLPVAPTVEPPPPSKAEMKLLQKRDHQLLNGLKIQLQPIMDQINRKYKKFRQPVIPPAQIDYLFAEADPNYIRPDLALGQVRPFEIVKDKHDNDVLRDTATGKTYYNLETTTIEERLSNGFYARPKDFLFDIKSLAKDAKNIGDKERTLKANELLSNVEVDVASIENSTSHIDWEALYRRQVQRAKETAEKERKRKAMQTILERVQTDVFGGNESDSQGPITLGEPVPGSRTTARFQVRSPLSNGHGNSGQEAHPLSNGTSHPSGEADEGDVTMSGVGDETQQASQMGPPPKHLEGSIAPTAMTQISQKSAVTSLPPGVSPSAVINEASTTKTSDPSTHRSSNFSQLTNGTHGEHRSGEDHDGDIPDTLLVPGQNQSQNQSQSQDTPSDEAWFHSQAQALSRGKLMPVSNPSGSTTSSRFNANTRHSGGSGSKVQSIGNLLNDPQPEEESSIRQSGSSTSASQQLSVDREVEEFIEDVTDRTGGCTIEQLEQINRELMEAIWCCRHEWNRERACARVKTAFNEVIADIETIQVMGPLSQQQSLGV